MYSPSSVMKFCYRVLAFATIFGVLAARHSCFDMRSSVCVDTSQLTSHLIVPEVCAEVCALSQCIAFNDRCILLDPGLAESHANLANALQQIGNFDMAIVYYQVRPRP